MMLLKPTGYVILDSLSYFEDVKLRSGEDVRSRYHLFVDDQENSKTSMKELEELLLINSSVVDDYFQICGDVGSGRSLYLHF